MNNKYPEHIMGILRQRLGLEFDDTSRDVEILTYSHNEVFDEVCEWEGLIDYGDKIRELVDSIYGIELG
jgi:hypothetical protein